MQVLGNLSTGLETDLQRLIARTEGLVVKRLRPARSSTPFPNSTDLELSLVPAMNALGFEHHVTFEHPRTGTGFEYDFWRAQGQVAVEIMGYRADDEVYKDILKFHVHRETRVGVVWVPRWKFVSGRRTEANYRATLKALAFADTYMQVEALIALSYDWMRAETGDGYLLKFV